MFVTHCEPSSFSGASSQAPDLSLADIISALSFALDLTEGAIPGHAVRTTLLGMRIARALDISGADQSALYYALQLKDIGCSNNAARMSQIFGGDDRAAKAMCKLSDWQGLFGAAQHDSVRSRVESMYAGLRAVPENARSLWATVRPGASFVTKIKHISYLNKNTDANTRELIKLRCDRGAGILRKLNLADAACEAILQLDEQWDGSGYPSGLSGQRISPLARIIAVAQNLDVFALAVGTREAVKVVKRRSGTWFDPEVVQTAVALSHSGDLWRDCDPQTPAEVSMHRVVANSPDLPTRLHADQIDDICEAFADVVDAKSPFTFRHSLGVAEVTRALTEALNLPQDAQQLLERGALLHDLGKLGVSNTILDKPGKLTPDELQVIWGHPEKGRTILARIAGFEGIARLACEHHEKLDGSGYPNKLPADQISSATRLLVIADCFSALIESRPYRPDMSVRDALAILRRDAVAKIDRGIFETLEGVVERWSGSLPPIFRTCPN